MKLTVKIRLKQLKKETLFEAYKKEEVLSYCQRCSNYSSNFSCPDFKFDAARYLEFYNYAAVIMTEIDTQPIKAQMDNLKAADFKSRVFKNNMKGKPDEQVNISSVISMYAFNDVKDQMADKLIEIEKGMDGVIGLPPGSCTRCEACCKQQEKPCIHPDTLRYSLEALGFKVSDIYKQCFDLELVWTKDVLPAALYSCSALMTKEKISESMILDKLNGMVLYL
ncbi:DUF2284 domain-containing protein [Clostridium sp. JN-1]|uniref:DUF2284 domain-containing protein n=1 Tax=Clostridium sp. JN-1 TaxID=2483110 RepID=UPI0016813F55|nr:DUF2284 domain-containing protein [Clostridium sp. JN-1]